MTEFFYVCYKNQDTQNSFLSTPVKPYSSFIKQTLFVGRVYFENPFIMQISCDEKTIFIADFYS